MRSNDSLHVVTKGREVNPPKYGQYMLFPTVCFLKKMDQGDFITRKIHLIGKLVDGLDDSNYHDQVSRNLIPQQMGLVEKQILDFIWH